MPRSHVARVVVVALSFLLPASPAHARPHRVASDFNGDGFADVVIGIPFESSRDAPYAGAVSVLYGGPDGVSSVGNQLWRPSSPGLDWGNPTDDYAAFGRETVVGNFDGDRFADLAISTPDWEQVNVLYGSSDGLTTRRDQRWAPDLPGFVQTDPPWNYRFGFRLETGDFNGDGYDELVLGMIDSADEPGEAHVRVMYGSGTGLTVEGNQLWSQATRGVRGRPQSNCCNHFGFALAAGDFGGGPQDDLAIGEPGGRKGSVHVLYGSARGVTAAADEIWSWESAGVPGTPPKGGFGHSLVAADFGGPSARDDLAIGTSTPDHAGAVIVLYAAAGGGGLSSASLQKWNQDTFGVNGEAEPGDGYGASLTAGDFDGDDATDLAIGVPGERSATGEYVGGVSVLYSRWWCGDILCAPGDQLWTPDALGIPLEAFEQTYFGAHLSFRDSFSGDHGDLVLGMPGMTVGESPLAGGVAVIYGTPGYGLASEGSQLWTLDSPGVLGRPSAEEYLGMTLG